MKVKTAELIGTALDWAVAKCEGLSVELIGCKDDDDPVKFWPLADKFSTNWSKGGTILQRKWIELTIVSPWLWYAELERLNADDDKYTYGYGYGPTPLVAAMRCYVASVLGDEVEIPEELL